MATLPPTPADDATPPPPASIGNALMRDDMSLELMLRAQHDDGSIAEVMLVLKPGDDEYPAMLERLGPMRPGDSRMVPGA